MFALSVFRHLVFVLFVLIVATFPALFGFGVRLFACFLVCVFAFMCCLLCVCAASFFVMFVRLNCVCTLSLFLGFVVWLLV